MNVKDLAYAAGRGGTPPTGMSGALKALWLARAGRWDDAHEMCKMDDSPESAWVHAHLHRVRGEEENAKRWYTKAGKEPIKGKTHLAEEWEEIAEAVLEIYSNN